jgi:hypothetical protein
MQVTAAERAIWLAELSSALDAARHLMRRLDLTADQHAEAIELHLRIEAARFEVQSLRLSRSLRPRDDDGPKWTESAPWEAA